MVRRNWDVIAGCILIWVGVVGVVLMLVSHREVCKPSYSLTEMREAVGPLNLCK